MSVFKDFASDGPVSWPINGEIRLDIDMGGFGWNADQGVFIPTSGDRFQFELPYPDLRREGGPRELR